MGTKERQEEMIDLERVLNEFGMNFESLVKATPKHEKTCKLLMKASQKLAKDTELMRELLKQKQLPVGEFVAKSNLSRKIVERHSKYLVSMVLIHNGPYPYLRLYLQTDIPQK
ncbi:MAG: hypothetical protein K6T85_14030 [Gorillibacterium sp.]|nr:hypothetical protein [Gorillibacterium sp.]